MDKILFANLLFDFYGQLLTEKQRKVYEMYFLDDLSMQEIGENFDVSRQSVNDLLKRTEKILENYEKKLLLVNKHLNRQKEISSIIEIIDSRDLKDRLNKLLEID